MSDTIREDLRPLIESLWQSWQEEAADDVEQLQRLIDPRAEARGNGYDRVDRYEHCAQARAALNVLVSAHITYITPGGGERWFSLKSRKREQEHSGRKTRAMQWYSAATQAVSDELAETNFYSVIHEVYRDRCLGGTGCMYIGGNDVRPMHFVHVPLGRFAIAEDAQGRVNTLVRKFRITAVQAAEEFGEENLPAYMRDALNDKTRRRKEKFEIYHLVRPAKEGVYGIQDLPIERREYEGVYVDCRDFAELETEGYYEFPYFVTRFERGCDSVYGTAPGVDIIPEIKRLMMLEKLQDTEAQVQAYPRILQLAGQNNQIDMRAGGITTVAKADAQYNLPREWASSGNYQVGLERIQAKEQAIRQAYFADMLAMFSGPDADKNMTATEATYRAEERVMSFSPSFQLFISDFRGAMRRILGILFRAGRLPMQDLPDDLFIQAEDGSIRMLNPNVCYLGKIAQAIERVQRRGIDSALQTVVSYTQATQDTRMLDALDIRLIARYIVESSGAPSDVILTDAQLEELDQQRAQAAAMQAQQEAMLAQAEAYNKTRSK